MRPAVTLALATAALAQPVTGYLLAREVGWSLLEGSILLALGLCVVVGLFWLPVVWMQLRLRSLAAEARDRGRPLPASHPRLYRVWFAFGVPAFAAVLVIVWLMIARPALG